MNARKLLVGALLSVTAASLAYPADANTIGITSSSSLGAFDTFNWAQLDPTFTTFPSPQSVVSDGGVNGTVSSAGGKLQTMVQGPDWIGNFVPGTRVLWDVGAGPDITIEFANPVAGAGAQIESGFFGAFTAQVTAYGAGNISLGSFMLNGMANSNNDGSAIFIGLLSDNRDIAKLQFVLTSASALPDDFAIGSLDFKGGDINPVPLGAMGTTYAPILGAFAWYINRRRQPSKPSKA